MNTLRFVLSALLATFSISCVSFEPNPQFGGGYGGGYGTVRPQRNPHTMQHFADEDRRIMYGGGYGGGYIHSGGRDPRHPYKPYLTADPEFSDRNQSKAVMPWEAPRIQFSPETGTAIPVYPGR